jgi:hypothetical protein
VPSADQSFATRTKKKKKKKKKKPIFSKKKKKKKIPSQKSNLFNIFQKIIFFFLPPKNLFETN